jgi:excisionase family DNA binding protein
MASNYEVLTVKEVCEILHVHPSTLYKLTRQGKIPSFKIGTDWRFRTDQNATVERRYHSSRRAYVGKLRPARAGPWGLTLDRGRIPIIARIRSLFSLSYIHTLLNHPKRTCPWWRALRSPGTREAEMAVWSNQIWNHDAKPLDKLIELCGGSC